jgi:2-succinyl-6-hydroxy-2,4-cyclohexadiene-1-carboxylate synthase
VSLPLVELVAGDTPPFVLLHGFTQNTGCWQPFADLLGRSGHQVMAIDLPGHGSADPRHDAADLWQSAHLLAATMQGSAHVVGYSMGGRMALHLALTHPHLVQSLTLIGATAGIKSPQERGARRRADNKLADHLVKVGVATFIDEWLAQPLFADLDGPAAHLSARVRNRPAGLAASLRHCGTGTQDDLWPRLDEIAPPMLVIAGARDNKFSELGRQFNRSLQLIANAGHSAHLAQPALCAREITAWVDQLGDLIP